MEDGDGGGRDPTDDPGDAAPSEGPFLLDAMCGTLAVYLRMCGYDAAYAPDRGVEADDEVRALALAEGRTLLTRDVALAGRTPGAICLRSRGIEGTLRELRDAGVRLQLPDRPARCGDCNGRLEPVSPDADSPEYAPDPAETDVWRCRDCGQHFWQGSHWDRVGAVLAAVS